MARPPLSSFVGSKPPLDSFVGSANLSTPTVQPNVNSPFTAALSTVSNIPSSAVNFAKSLIGFFNPLEAVSQVQKLTQTIPQAAQEGVSLGNVLKEIPQTAYHALVPQFVQQIMSGDTEGAQRTIEQDPVGQIAPLVLMGKGLADRVGVGATFDSALSKVAMPVTKPVEAVTNFAGRVGAGVLGGSTGTGAASVKAAFSASPSFVEAMRGKISPEDVVKNAEEMVQTIADQRRSAYLTDLQTISENKKSLDISPIINEVTTQLRNFGIKETGTGLDFSRSSIANNPAARSDIQGVYETLKTWGTQAGDRTPVGLDILKKQLGDFYSQSNNARSFVQAVKSKVTNILNEVPDYKKMTSSYAKASQLLDDIKSTTGIGGKARADTVFTKMTTALKADKELRQQVMNEMMHSSGDPNLINKLAGINMSSLTPRGLVGKGIEYGAAFQLITGVFNPQYIPIILGTSPRFVGEMVRTFGVSTKGVKAIYNAVSIAQKLPATSAIAPSVQSLRSQQQ